MTQLINPDLTINYELPVVVGSVADWSIQLKDADGTLPVFASGDAITGFVFQGDDQSALFSPQTIWTGGTGYATGAVTVSPTTAQTLLLEPNGDFILQLWWTSADGTRTACYGRAIVQALAGPGSGTSLTTPYCQLSDLLLYAPWIKIVQDTETDQEGFYLQRLQARTWMDWLILNNYRGSFVGLFEYHSITAFEFGYVGWRRSLGPSGSLLAYLEAGPQPEGATSGQGLILRPQIVRACAYKALELIGCAQIGVNNQLANLGFYYRDMAMKEAIATTAEVNPNTDAVGTLFINLSSTNSLMT
jgi:hypothetical protein